MPDTTLPRYVFSAGATWPRRYSRLDSFDQNTDYRPATAEELLTAPTVAQYRRSVYAVKMSIVCNALACLAGGGADVLLTTYSFTDVQVAYDQGEGLAPVYEIFTGTWKKEGFSRVNNRDGTITVSLSLRREGSWVADTAPEGSI